MACRLLTRQDDSRRAIVERGRELPYGQGSYRSEYADGLISRSKYRQMIEAWNGRETDTDAIFGRLDRNGDGHISREEFRQLWTQFWAGDDPSHPGTWVFGRFEHPVGSIS